MSKIFISVASKEKALGEIFSRSVDHIFNGNLTCQLLELKPGDEWKRQIKSNLSECDILVSFLTPFFIEKPWAYVEWAAFWLSEDKYTFLILPEQYNASISQLFDPFHDVQAAFINDEESIENILLKIQQISGGVAGRSFKSEGNKLSKDLCIEYNEILMKRKTEKYSIYKNDLDKLPFFDHEIKEIALHFYDIDESKSFFDISEKIMSEEIKYEMAKYILSKKDYTTFNSFIDLIETNDKLLALLKWLVYREDQADTPIVIKVIDKIKSTSGNSILPYNF